MLLSLFRIFYLYISFLSGFDSQFKIDVHVYDNAEYKTFKIKIVLSSLDCLALRVWGYTNIRLNAG